MRRKPAGLTLIELLVVMAVAGILAAVAVPQLSAFVREQALESQANLLAGDLRQARSEALRRNAPVRMCVRTVGAETCAEGTDWKTGWLMYADTNGDGALSGGELIKAQDALQNTGATTSSATGGATAVQFLPTGIANDTFSFSLLPQSGTQGTRYICLARSGRVLVKKEAC